MKSLSMRNHIILVKRSNFSAAIIIMPTQNEEFEHAQPHNFSEAKQF